MSARFIDKMTSESSVLNSVALLGLRLFFGLTMLLAHGWSKLTSFSERASSFPDPLGVGSFASLSLTVGAEVFAAGALVLGLFTRLATLPLIFAMGMAFFVIHGDDPWQRRELAFVYLGSFLVLLIAGGGRFSLDRFLNSEKSRRRA